MLLLFIPSKVAPPPSLRLAGLRGQGGVGQRSRCFSLGLPGPQSGVQWAKVIRKNETAKEKGKFSFREACPFISFDPLFKCLWTHPHVPDVSDVDGVGGLCIVVDDFKAP